MKKALVLVSLASLAAVSFGCVLTDYILMPTQNKSHGLIGCESNDRIANSQQTVEAQTRDLLYTTTFGGPSVGGSCTTGFDPGVSLDTVSHEDARDWNRFNANWMFFGETQVFGVPNGTWALAGVKDLADGSVRINNMHTDSTGAFSCVGDRVDGRYGGPEGVVYGDAFGRLPGLHIDAIAIDRSSANVDFCPNIAAVSADAASTAFSTYWGQTARAYEGSLAATPITRREFNLGRFLGGESQSVTINGVTITGRGQLNADGSIRFELQNLSSATASYQAETPVVITANPANRFKTMKIENAVPAELTKMATFALNTPSLLEPVSLANIQVQDLGYTFGDVSFLLNRDALARYVANPSDWQ